MKLGGVRGGEVEGSAKEGGGKVYKGGRPSGSPDVTHREQAIRLLISDGLLALSLTDISQIRLFVLIRFTRASKSTSNFHFDFRRSALKLRTCLC